MRKFNKMYTFPNHFNGNTTYVIGHWCANGCQCFNLNKAPAVFRAFDVPEDMQLDVYRAMAKYESGVGFDLHGEILPQLADLKPNVLKCLIATVDGVEKYILDMINKNKLTADSFSDSSKSLEAFEYVVRRCESVVYLENITQKRNVDVDPEPELIYKATDSDSCVWEHFVQEKTNDDDDFLKKHTDSDLCKWI